MNAAHSMFVEVKNGHRCCRVHSDGATVWSAGSGRCLDLTRRHTDSAMIAIDIGSQKQCRDSSSPAAAASRALLKWTL